MNISIVLLSYNYFDETTGLCFESLARDPDFKRWELIVVDNGSDDATSGRLRSLKEVYCNVRFIFNEKNLGFAGGINAGIRHASGEAIVLLNSDTLCPEGMIGRLAGHLSGHLGHDRRRGMVAPVTNAAGNEQWIYTRSSDVQGIITEGLRYANDSPQELLDAYRLDFCCVAIARNALEETELLDEGFGRGYFDDFDYSLRMKGKGFSLAVAEDVFIYHRGSAAFGKTPGQADKLLKQNKRRIIEKYGKKTVFPSKRECNLSVLAQYAGKKERGESVSGYRIANRLQGARLDRPKGWIKRWRYLQRVGAVAKRLGIDS